jgi:sugar phosphate permease
MTAGALVMGGGFALFSLVQSLWHLYVLNVVAAFGLACVAWLPNQTLISNWFEKKRGMAMGISVAGIGFGGLAMATLAGFLIAEAGWRISFAALGGLVLVVVASVIVALIRDRPADLGLEPDGARTPEGAAAAPDAPLPGLEVGEAVRTSAFGLLAALHFFWVLANMSVIAHLVAFLRDHGFEQAPASLALGLMVGASVIGRLLFGTLADRFTKPMIMCAGLLLHGASVLFLFRIEATGALPGFIALFGIALGGVAVMIPLIVGECFGLRAFGKTLGLVMIPATLGAAIGPVLTGLIFDVTGSYVLAFVLHVASFVIAALLW